MDSSLVEGGLNVTLTIRLLMHGKVSCDCVHCLITLMTFPLSKRLKTECIPFNVCLFSLLQEVGSIIGKVRAFYCQSDCDPQLDPVCVL